MSDEGRRRGILGSVADGAGGLVQSVANRVAPGVVGAIDVDEVVQRTDVQALLDRIDVQQVLERVDLDALLERLDVDALLQRVDVDALVQRIDLDALLSRTELSAAVARSSAGVAGHVVDLARSHGVSLDDAVHRWVDRLLRRRPALGGEPGT